MTSRLCFLTATPVFLLLILPSFLFAAEGEQTREIHTPGAVIRFDKRLEGAAQEVARLVPDVALRVKNELGWELGYRPTIILIGNRNDFEDLGAGTRTLAFASGNRGLIVIDNSRIRTEPLNLGSILSHEWVHLVLHEQIPPGRLPRWLNEGLAQRIGGGTAEIVLMEGTGKRLQQAVLSNRRMEFHDLSADFPHKDPGLSLAYEQSRSFVDYLFDRIGREGMLKALRSLTQGGSIEMSLETAAGIPFQDLEGGWRETLNRRVTWLAYISNNFPFFLFLFAAGLTVLGFFRMLIQRRNYRDEDEFS